MSKAAARGDDLPRGTELLTVPVGEALPLARVIKTQYPDLSWGRIRKMCAAGRVTVGGQSALDGRRTLTPGAQIAILPEGKRGVTGVDRVTIRFQDRHVVVVEKPSGISTEPFDGKESDTLISRLRRTLAEKGIANPEGMLKTVHRLDKETSGLLMFARSQLAWKKLSNDLRRRRVERSYLAVVSGVLKVGQGTFRSFLGRPRGGRKLTSVKGGGRSGKEAITHYEVIERYAKASLLRCRLETGRTHQIRIHLSEAGHPLVGERIYLRGAGDDLIPFARVALHATTLAFEHPVNHRRMHFESRLPDDLTGFIGGMGSRRREANRPINPPGWAKKAKGGRRIRSLKDLLEHAAEAPDWKAAAPKDRLREQAAIAVDEGGWLQLEGGQRSDAGPAAKDATIPRTKPTGRRVKVGKKPDNKAGR